MDRQSSGEDENDIDPSTPEKTDAKGTFNPVVFSRKETYNGPMDDEQDEQHSDEDPAERKSSPSQSALSSIVTQTDANGNPQNNNIPSPNSPHAMRRPRQPPANDRDEESDEDDEAPYRANRSLASRICCCFGSAPETAPRDSDLRHSGMGSENLLGPVHPDDRGMKCLVLDLDETLVHSSFKPTQNPDYIIPVDIEGTIHRVYVCKRPGVDEFMRVMGLHFEIVIYTASLSKYANPLLDELDIHKVIRHRLFREHCVNHEGSFVKDLSLLGRSMADSVIIDNSPLSYIWHVENAIGCGTFIDSMADREMIQMQNFLVQIKDTSDVTEHMFKWAELSMNDREKLGRNQFDVLRMCDCDTLPLHDK